MICSCVWMGRRKEGHPPRAAPAAQARAAASAAAGGGVSERGRTTAVAVRGCHRTHRQAGGRAKRSTGRAFEWYIVRGSVQALAGSELRGRRRQLHAGPAAVAAWVWHPARTQELADPGMSRSGPPLLQLICQPMGQHMCMVYKVGAWRLCAARARTQSKHHVTCRVLGCKSSFCIACGGACVGRASQKKGRRRPDRSKSQPAAGQRSSSQRSSLPRMQACSPPLTAAAWQLRRAAQRRSRQCPARC